MRALRYRAHTLQKSVSPVRGPLHRGALCFAATFMLRPGNAAIAYSLFSCHTYGLPFAFLARSKSRGIRIKLRGQRFMYDTGGRTISHVGDTDEGGCARVCLSDGPSCKGFTLVGPRGSRGDCFTVNDTEHRVATRLQVWHTAIRLMAVKAYGIDGCT
eukprot:SAG31_NODE_2159_length_6302_cov_9.311140_11_plen_158_part_00